MTYTLPDLAYDPGALAPHLDPKVIGLHHDKHHAAYVAGANTALDKLDEARAAERWADLPGLERTLAFNLGGHVLHTIYWRNLSPTGGGEPTGALRSLIDDTFDGFASFQAMFSQATITIQGSGWSLLSWEPLGQRLIVQQLGTHHDNHVLGATPLLAIDAWEHAYYAQYFNVRADYVKAIWNIIDWTYVAARLAAAQSSLS